MPETTENPGLLVNLAAEGIATVINGCAKAVGSARDPNRNAATDMLPRAINFFGPRIVERWIKGLTSKSKDDQVDLISKLAALSLADTRREALGAVEQFSAAAAPEDKSLAVEYLSAIPLSIRRNLVHDPETGKMTLPTVMTVDDGQTLIRLLPTDAPPFPIGSDLPGTTYQLEELLGIGGFGAVYKAKNRCEQHQPPRAIKFCLDSSMLATLHRERAILDRLMSVDSTKWSNRIVRLYGYALEANPPFLVYEYVPGGDLTSNLRMARQKTGRGFRPALALELMRQVTEALAFAHSQGLVHRDLKPANVLVSGSKIKLTDFGIGGVVATHAARSGASVAGASQMSAADQTALFRGSGTPLYMSPEQRRGDQPDPRHDLYSLGVMWYQLIVGDVSRELHPGWPDELMEEYQTPKEHIEVIQKCVGYFKKRPAHGAELLSMLPAAAPTGGAPSVVAPATSTRDAEFDRLKLLLADQIERDAISEARETVNAMLAIKPNDPEAIEVRDFIDQRSVAGLTELNVFTDHKGWVRGVAFGPDGRRAVSGSDDRTVIIWDLDARRPLRVLSGHGAAVMGVAYAPDGCTVLSGSWDASARVWDANTGQELRKFTGAWKAVKSVAFSPDSKTVLFSTDDNKIHFFDVDSGREIQPLEGHTEQVQSVVYSPDGRMALSGGDDSTVRIWDLKTGEELRCFAGHTDSVTSVAFAPNNRWILSGSSDHTARLWDVQTGKELRRFGGHANWVNSVTFFPAVPRIMTGSGGEIVNNKFSDGTDTTVRIWDLQTEKELFRYDKHKASVTGAVFGPGGKLILSCSLDKTVRLLMLPG